MVIIISNCYSNRKRALSFLKTSTSVHVVVFLRILFLSFTANKSKVYYGIPPEPDLGVVIEEENEDEDDKDKPKVTLSSSLQSY